MKRKPLFIMILMFLLVSVSSFAQYSEFKEQYLLNFTALESDQWTVSQSDRYSIIDETDEFYPLMHLQDHIVSYEANYSAGESVFDFQATFNEKCYEARLLPPDSFKPSEGMGYISNVGLIKNINVTYASWGGDINISILLKDEKDNYLNLFIPGAPGSVGWGSFSFANPLYGLDWDDDTVHYERLTLVSIDIQSAVIQREYSRDQWVGNLMTEEEKSFYYPEIEQKPRRDSVRIWLKSISMVHNLSPVWEY
jgi:hypothetical protein